jgi:hypothetical protein
MNIGRKIMIVPMKARIVADIERNIDMIITLVNGLIIYRNRLAGIFFDYLVT